MRALGVVIVAGFLAFTLTACSSPVAEPLQLSRSILTVDNRTDEEWQGVELWVNNYYRALAPSIAAHGRLQVQLDSFISGYGRRFDYTHAQITDLRLKAKHADGTPFELKKKFQGSPLNDAIGGNH